MASPFYSPLISGIVFYCVCSLSTALAEDKRQVPPPLPAPSNAPTDKPLPEVNIIRQKDKTIEEYRINGKLRYIKIIPKNGVAYYMIDTDGDGKLETRQDDLENPPINQWILWR